MVGGTTLVILKKSSHIMKYYRLFIGLLSLTAVACTVEEPFSKTESISEDDVFYAVIDEESATKTYIDAGLNVLWNKGDCITIFNDVTLPAEYEFQGDDGDTGGKFSRIVVEEEAGGDDFYGGTALNGKIFAIYPHSEDTKIVPNGTITYTFPDVQTYLEKSFGPGANVMVAEASTSNKTLSFKNAMGYLSFKLWGDNVHVSSVILKANGGEAIAGKGTIVVSEGKPVVSMDASNSKDKIRLYCDDEPIGSSATEYTEFWFALPPVSFKKANGGFTITVTTTNGGVFTKTASIDLDIKRNTVERMAPVKVVPQYTQNTINLNTVSSTRSGVEYKAQKEDDTFTLTMPTVTDFSQLVLDFTIDGEKLMVGGKEVTSGVTPVDASEPLSLVVCRGDYEKTFTLIARNTGLPVVRITTEGFTLADIEGDEEHETWLPSTEKPGSAFLRIEKANGEVDLDNASMSIKGRGNATWKYNKRPYALKLDKKSKVLGMKSHKRWILLANWKDRTLLRNDAAFWLSKQSGLAYTVKGQFVELEFNGEHRGNYYLCEQIKIDKDRLNITKIEDNEVGSSDPYLITGPYLMEIDNNYDEKYKFISGFYGPSNNRQGMKFMFKEPDEVLSDEGFNYMKTFIQNLETRIKAIPGGDYSYRADFDFDSAIWFMFVNELTGNGDFFNTDSTDPTSQWYGPHSTYMYKDRDVKNADGTTTQTKLFMGPVWDFDYKTFITELKTTSWNGRIQTENRIKWVGANNQNYYYYYLCKDPEFRARMLYLWNGDEGMNNGYKHKIASAFGTYVDQMADYIRLSEEINTAMWGYSNTSQDQGQNGDNGKSFQEAVNLMKDAFTNKLTYMNNNIGSLNQ